MARGIPGQHISYRSIFIAWFKSRCDGIAFGNGRSTTRHQINSSLLHTYCMVLTTSKTGIAGQTYTLHGAYYFKDRDSRPHCIHYMVLTTSKTGIAGHTVYCMVLNTLNTGLAGSRANVCYQVRWRHLHIA